MRRSATMKLITIMAGLSLSTLVFGCGASNQGPPVSGSSSQTEVTSAQSVDATVVGSLTAARCDQEQSCKNIGPGAKYASRSVCTEQIRGSIANDLNGYDCPRGIDSDALARCIEAIKSEECSHPFDTLTRQDKCRTSGLCMK
jgi:hypothetical protein